LTRPDQSEVSFLDQIVQGEFVALIPLNDGDYQAQVRQDQLLPGGFIPALDAGGQLVLLGGRQEIRVSRRIVGRLATRPGRSGTAFGTAVAPTSITGRTRITVVFPLRPSGPLAAGSFARLRDLEGIVQVHHQSLTIVDRSCGRGWVDNRCSE